MQSRTLQHRTAAYWPQFKGLKDRLTSYGVFVGNKMSSMGVDVDVGMVDDQPKARAASDRFVQESVDLIVCYVTTYSTSSQVLPAVQQVGRPVLVLNLQPTAQLDYAQTGTPGRVIVVDAQTLRCEIAGKLGPDEVINVSETDSVAEVKRLTDGKGADLVVECVGGNAGIQSFEQAQRMLAPGGAIHLIAKYQGGPLPLEGDSFMNKQLVAGIRIDQPRETCMAEAADMLIDGRVKVSDLITHRLPWEETPNAYHLLYEKPGEALGVILEWD